MWAGVTSLQESVGRIVNPEEASYDAVKGAYDLAQGDNNIIEVHGFYVDEDAKYASFDLVISFDAPDRHVVLEHIKSTMEKQYPGYSFSVALDPTSPTRAAGECGSGGFPGLLRRHLFRWSRAALSRA